MRVKANTPDFTEIILIGVLAIWTSSVFYLLWQASTFDQISLISWTSLTAFFTGFSTIVFIVIAILLAEIRRELMR